MEKDAVNTDKKDDDKEKFLFDTFLKIMNTGDRDYEDSMDIWPFLCEMMKEKYT